MRKANVPRSLAAAFVYAYSEGQQALINAKVKAKAAEAPTVTTTTTKVVGDEKEWFGVNGKRLNPQCKYKQIPWKHGKKRMWW